LLLALLQTNKQTNKKKDEEMALTLPNKDVLYQLILLEFFSKVAEVA